MVLADKTFVTGIVRITRTVVFAGLDVAAVFNVVIGIFIGIVIVIFSAAGAGACVVACAVVVAEGCSVREAVVDFGARFVIAVALFAFFLYIISAAWIGVGSFRKDFVVNACVTFADFVVIAFCDALSFVAFNFAVSVVAVFVFRACCRAVSSFPTCDTFRICRSVYALGNSLTCVSRFSGSAVFTVVVYDSVTVVISVVVITEAAVNRSCCYTFRACSVFGSTYHCVCVNDTESEAG